jgi:superfamily II DNA or RNA helicase
MTRFFSKLQRRALLIQSGFRCQSCGADLDLSFHADHIIPYSKGGKTDVTNGQALCRACNLSKGSNMAKPIKLRNWQQDAQDQVKKRFNDGEQFFLLQATPGGGKTICALSIFNEIRKRGIVSHLVVLAPSTTMVNQWRQQALDMLGIELSSSLIYNTMPDFNRYQGMVMTYQAMNENHQSLRIFCEHNSTLVIADEMHHVADGKSWGDSFQNGFENSKHILGLTGTPWASSGQTIPYVKYGIDGYALPDFRYGKVSAIKDKVCRVTEFYPMEATNLTFINETTGEDVGTFETLDDARKAKVPGAYTKTLRNSRHMKAMFLEADDKITEIRNNGQPMAGGLLVAPDIRTAHKFQDEIFSLTGVDYPIVHSKADKPHERINQFRDEKTRWLISVDMVTEGVDIKRLQVLLFLSAKSTELFLRQVIGRIERVMDENKYSDLTSYFYYTNTPELYDLVKRIEEENKAGLELRFCEECGQNPCECVCFRCNVKPCVCPPGIGPGEGGDVISLHEVETEQKGLIANGFDFDAEIVKRAILRKRSSAILADVPLFVICKVIMSEADQPGTTEQARDERPAVPLDIQKDRLRKRIHKEVSKKLGLFLKRQPDGKTIKAAHTNINRIAGITVTDSATSMAHLERKHDYIITTEAESWL